MKKRILAIVLGVAMTLSMVGCGSKEQTPATTPDKQHQMLLQKKHQQLQQKVTITTLK